MDEINSSSSSSIGKEKNVHLAIQASNHMKKQRSGEIYNNKNRQKTPHKDFF